MKGLKPEPGWRQAWVTWLYWLLLKSKPPTSDRTAPSCGLAEIKAPSASGSWTICQSSWSSFWMRITAPRRLLRVLEVDESFGAAIAVAPVVFEQALAKGRIGCLLIGARNRRVDAKPTRVDVIRIAFIKQLTDHLGDELGVNLVLGDGFALDADRSLLRLFVLLVVEQGELVHAPQHIQLALLRAFGIDDGVKGGGSLGQPGKHRDLGRIELRQSLAEVDLRRCAEPVGLLAEIDLVDIDLQDLIFAEAIFDLERQQRLVQFAGQRFFPGKKKVSRDLHRDRRSPLSLAAGHQVGVGCAAHPVVVDPGMLVKALVLGREDGLFHQSRNLLDADDRTALFAELPDQQAVGGVDAQRDLRLVLGERLDGGQVGVRQKDHETSQRQTQHSHPGQRQHREGEPSKPHSVDVRKKVAHYR